jgi:hypothetical protein
MSEKKITPDQLKKLKEKAAEKVNSGKIVKK